MKTALDWWNSNYDNFDGTAKDTIGVIQQIQLDAIKEGMNRAAKMHELGDSVHSMEQFIFKTANNLTLKDL